MVIEKFKRCNSLGFDQSTAELISGGGRTVHTYKYTMMYQSNTTQLYYVYYCTRATCFNCYRIIFRPF